MTNREQRLTRRIEELNDRLAELGAPNDPLRGGYDRSFYASMSDAETDHVLPEHLYTVQDVLAALRRAKDALYDLRCERRLAAAREEAIPGQLAFALFALPLAS